MIWAAAPITAVVLCLPCFRFPYEWDDFDFLARTQNLTWDKFLPDSRIIFYRPLSREGYFSILWAFGPDGAIWGHVLNAMLLAVAVVLLVSCTTRLVGAKAGFLSGALFAALGTLPVLVGTINCVQDLLAIVFILLALKCHLDGKPGWGVLAMGAALLSKETAVALIPAMLGVGWVLGSTWRRLRLVGLGYAGLLSAWIAIHPGFHALLARKFASGGVGYIGLDNPDRLASMGKTLLTLVNAPVLGPILFWNSEYTAPLILGSILMLAALFVLRKRPTPAHSRAPERRVIGLAIGMTLLPIIACSLLVRNWAPYYSCIPALGSSILLGLALSRLPIVVDGLALLVFLLLGVLFRQMSLDPSIITETTARPTAFALDHVRSQFRSLHPTMPRGAHALVSVGATGTAGVSAHIHRFQALRIWYDDPELRTYRPSKRVPTQKPELLFRITPDLSVMEIDPNRGGFRSAGSAPQVWEIRAAIRGYAKAVAVQGDVPRAATMLLAIPGRTEADRGYDSRLAAALLFAGGHEEEGQRILDTLRPISYSDALDQAALTALELAWEDKDYDALIRAFGISGDDIGATRYVMRRADEMGYGQVALSMARRIQRTAIGDPESAELIRKLTSISNKDLVAIPANEP
ncbi:MAG TPA: hypothetical protein VGQ14_06590 [Candidatus Eisenbacteria bacterium]|nr:hypothetical protein [Candidatus Eisenbacteria bacterium]